MKPGALILGEKIDSDILKRVLSKSGYEIDRTQSEIEALNEINNGSFSLFFLNMQGIETLGVIKRAIEVSPGLRVIAMADHPTVEMAVECMRAGVYDFLIKPIDKNRLKVLVDMAIDISGLHSGGKEELFYKQLAITDGLTEVYNHRYFHEILSREIERAKRYPQHISLLMADVDDFKRYNDSHGHQAGDMALKFVAQDITRQVRQVDLVARYGGEEFAIILPNASKQTGHTLASRIRSSVTQIRIKQGKASSPQEQITISIGLATYPDEAKTKDELIAKADKALYAAKAHGKNRVFAFW